MRAMNLTIRQRRDDESIHRLFSYINKIVPFELEMISFIKENVYKVKVKNNTATFILKGFPSLDKLRTQEYFTYLLKKNGFSNTYSFYQFTKKKLYFESRYFGFMEFIPPSNNPYSFDSQLNLMEGLLLLKSYHRVSEQLVETFNNALPSFSIIRKWEERFLQFRRNMDLISMFIPEVILMELIKWGQWSLLGIYKEKTSYYKYPAVILHGDLAHHNFLRSKEDKLFLIDFDLISIGPEIADYLQFANRILPFLNWSIGNLYSFEPFHPYFKEKMFLYALCFPTDIFREWNLLIRERSFFDPKKVCSVVDYTWNKIDKRQSFYKEILSHLR
jgi:hypothetical protein